MMRTLRFMSAVTLIVIMLSSLAGSTFAASTSHNVTLRAGTPTTAVFTNTDFIEIAAGGASSGPADPYPSTLAVSGINGSVLDVNVTLYTVVHTFPDDINVLLVGPGGDMALLWADACGGWSEELTGGNLTFDQEAATVLPDDTYCATGAYQPADYGGNAALPVPAPAPPYPVTLAGYYGLEGANVNGTWELWVWDDVSGDVGSITGWDLEIEYDKPTPPAEVDEEEVYVPSAEDEARAAAPLCADMDGTTNEAVRASMSGGEVTGGGVYCRMLDDNMGMAVGNADLMEMHPIHAVDVYGMAGAVSHTSFNSSVEICLAGTGQLAFLDASAMPRTLSWLPTTYSGGYSCGRIYGAGTVVLVP